MGESVAEATITSWLKEVGDTIELDEAIVEIATDKVDSEVPSEVEGVLVEKLYEVDAVVKVGETLAIIEISGDNLADEKKGDTKVSKVEVEEPKEVVVIENAIAEVTGIKEPVADPVKTIAKKENISMDELESIVGTGKDNRITKNDILTYVENRANTPLKVPVAQSVETKTPVQTQKSSTKAPVSVNGQDEIIEMTRMGKLVSQHMVNSIQTAAHVQSFIEVDVTKIVNWRNKVKDSFFKREGEKITFTPIFMEAVAKTIKDFPLINITVDGDRVIKKKNINLGMAAALADGNLIVPVIKNADQLNLMGMTKAVNDLALRARTGKLKPDDTQGGTYTVTNVGGFGSVMGTPIINQPQVAILALGAIRKVPAVIETSEGDFIGIRHKMFLSHSYDHRVVNGALGGMFIQRVAQYLEEFDVNREF
ncbi:UNVERIFIED_CONTAM: hypothetical protein GTU68_047143 [Idotea baltica]|nr:hypothetical protein [Idotea baltica]